MKKKGILLGFLALVLGVCIAVGLMTGHSHPNTLGGTGSTTQVTDTPQTPLAPLEEVGPGGCVPGKSILDELRKTPPVQNEDFKAPYDQVEIAILTDHWITWVQGHESTNCVKAMAASVNVKVTDLPSYLRDKVKLTAIDKPITVQNTYFDKDTGQIVDWKVQTFSANELIWYVGDVPTFKFVCGNRLYPVGQHAPPAKTTTATIVSCAFNCGSMPRSKCTSNCGTASPRCQTNCGPTPPPGCKTNCSPSPPKNCTNGSSGTYPACHTPPKPPCSVCVSKAQVNQPVQNNTTAANNGANTGSTAGAPKTVPVNTVAPVNNRGDGTTKPTKAPDPTSTGVNSGHNDGSTTPSGSTTNSGGTTTGGGVTNAPVDTGQGNTSASGVTVPVNTGMPTTPG